MITTVTLSPCIDKTATVAKFDPDRMNRVESSRLDAGGKGINVCLALSALEIKSRAIYLNFDGGEIINSALEKAGVEAEQVKCSGRIRTNLKIYDSSTGKTIELNEQNPTIAPKAQQKLAELVVAAAEDSSVIVFSGSVPAGFPKDIYKQLILAAKQANPKAKIVLDCEGESLISGLEASPYMIKPNLEELERSFGTTILSDEEVVALSREIALKYKVGVVLVSLGDRGAIAVTSGEEIRASAKKIRPKSAQGAGDAMVAGACWAISMGLGLRDIIRFGTCAAAGAVEREGTAFCPRERFEELVTSKEE